MNATDIECQICGDQHGESSHSDPLVQRDTGRDTVTGLVDTFAWDAEALLVNVDVHKVPSANDCRRKLTELIHEWAYLTDDQRDEFAPEYLDDVDAILSDAGFIPVTDGYQGTWAVYAPIPEPTVSV